MGILKFEKDILNSSESGEFFFARIKAKSIILLKPFLLDENS